MRTATLLYTYLAAEILAPLLASFIIVNSVMFLGRIVPLLDTLLDYGISLADFTRLCLYITPQLLVFSIPMATMLGIIIAFNRLAGDNELLALKVGGVSPMRMMPPVIALSLLMACTTALCSVYLIPTGTLAMEKMLFQLAKEKIDHGLQAKRFSENLGPVVLYIDTIDHQTREWQGVYVSDLRDQSAPTTVMAQTGSLEADTRAMLITLSLNNGSLHRTKGDSSQDISFNRYTLNLNLPQPSGELARQGGKRTMTQAQLIKKAHEYGTTTEKGINLLIEYQSRLVLAAGCLILGILGFPLGSLATPGRRPPGIPLGLFFFITYFMLFSAGKTMSEEQIIPLPLAMWLPNIIFGFLAGYLLFATARETLIFQFERAGEPFLCFFDRVKAKLPSATTDKTGRSEERGKNS